MHLMSPAFDNDGPFPEAFTKTGERGSPPLRLQDVPTRTRELAIVLVDITENFVYWFAYAIPGHLSEIPSGPPYQSQLDAGGIPIRQGKNSLGKTGYEPPPTTAGRHHYAFHAYALDAPLNLPEEADAREFFLAAKGHIVAQATLHATYERSLIP